MRRRHGLAVVFFFAWVSASLSKPDIPKFIDRTAASGLTSDLANKYGGPVVADLDGDGWDDIILNEHFRGTLRIYRRSTGRSFNLTYAFPGRQDWHGIATNDFQKNGRQDLIIGRGGQNGLRPSAPFVLQFDDGSPAFTLLPESSYGFDQYKGRLRAVRMIDLDLDGDMDALIFAAGSPPDTPPGELVFYENDGTNSWTLYKTLFNADCRHAVLTTDVDSDGILDLICAESRMLTVYRGTGSFPVPYEDVTDIWLDAVQNPSSSFSHYDYMAELDFNNDGRMDIYASCGFNFTLWPCDDMLLENTGKDFIDVSRQAQLPQGGIHQEPAVGDFNLDGFVDLLVPTYGTDSGVTPNLLLLNRGDGTFETVKVHGLNINPALGFRGHGASPILLGRGGRLDVVLAYEGSNPDGSGGPWKLYKNRMPKEGREFLALKVLDIPTMKVLARGARVTIVVGSRTMTRRVGNDGGESQSLPARVHFGLGRVSIVDSVTISYVGGVERKQFNISAGFRTSLSV